MANFDVTNSNGRFTLRLTVTETATSTANNTSTLSYSLKLIANTSYHFSYYQIGYTVKLNGKTVASIARADSGLHDIASYGTLTLCSGTYTVTHNSDGSLSMPVAWSIDMKSVDYTPGPLSGTGTMALTTIPRASTIGATAANIGEVSTITVSRKSTSFTHSIAYKFGSLTGYIAADGSIVSSEIKITATSIAFAVPTSFYAQIPSAKSGKCTLTITTYSGATKIGDAQVCSFTATAAQSVCAPMVAATAKDTNATAVALTGSASRVLKGVSNMLVSSTAAAKNGAAISSVTVVCGPVSKTGTSVTIAGAESATITVTAKDSRGYSTTIVVSGLTLVEYFTPTMSATAERENQTSNVVNCKISGNWFNGLLGAVTNTLMATVQYKSSGESEYTNGGTVAIAVNGNTYAGTLQLSGLDYQSVYTILFSLSDSVGAIDPLMVPVTKGTPVCDWGDGNFVFNVPVYFRGGVGAAAKLNAGADANDCIRDGIYAVPSDAVAASCSNLPSAYAGLLVTFNALGEARDTGNYLYKSQIYISRANSEAIKWRSVSNGADGVWTYSSWAER